MEARKLNINLARLAVAGTLVLTSVWLGTVKALATNRGDVVKSSPAANADPNRVVFGHIPASSDKVVVVSEAAKIIVSQSGAGSDITVSSNSPRNWNLNGSQVRQAGFSEKRNGVAMLADALGNRAIVNGQIYVLPQGQMKGMNLGPGGVFIKLPTGPDGALESKKLDPLAGSSLPGPGGTPDCLEISVPASFTGTLVVGAASTSEVLVPLWKSGGIEVSLMGQSKLTAGDISGSPKAVIDNRGKESAEVDKLNAKLLVLNVSGAGKINVKSGGSDMTNVTVEGTGTIDMKGKYNKLQKAVNGEGQIRINQ